MNMLIVGHVYPSPGDCRCASHMLRTDCELEVRASVLDQDCTAAGPSVGQKQAPKPRVGNHR